MNRRIALAMSVAAAFCGRAEAQDTASDSVFVQEAAGQEGDAASEARTETSDGAPAQAQPAPVAPAPVAPASSTTSAPVAHALPASTTPSPAPAPTDASAASQSATPAESAAEPASVHPGVVRRTRLIGAYRAGFGGSIDYDYSEVPFSPEQTVSDDLILTQSVLVRLEIPAGPYVSVGGMLQLSSGNSERADQLGESAFSLFDLGVLVRGRYAIKVGSITLEPSIAIPVGFTTGVFDKDLTGQPAFGWHIGLLFGGQVFIGDHFGLLIEAGWLRHSLNVDGRNGPVDATLSQGLFQLGIVVAVGA